MIFIGVGSNLCSEDGKSPIENCREALKLLVCDGVKIECLSSFYETSPVPASKQPWYVNGVVSVSTNLTPLQLLEIILNIETVMGRDREKINEPRIIDLDLLIYDNKIINTLDLVLPHPRIADRAFVLKPLAELTANWSHPVTGTHITMLLENLDSKQVVRSISS